MRILTQWRWKLVCAFLVTAVLVLEFQAFLQETSSSAEYPPPSQESYVDSLSEIQSGHFEHPERIFSPDASFINLGMIVINVKKTPQLSFEFRWKLERTLGSMLDYGSGTPLHFIIVTDIKSLKSVTSFFSQLISKKVAKNLMKEWKWKKRKVFPVIKISFVDIEKIIEKDRPFFTALKNSSMIQQSKYTADLFYIAPLYHKAFTSLDRIIFIDSSDLEFFDDVLLLQEQFEKMDEELLGVGLDLSPHYRNIISVLAGDPQTSLGLPGHSQGFNTGVVLFQLDRMRQSEVLAHLLQPDKVQSLLDKYGIARMSLGDQDWLTCLGLDQPQLFYVLPCHFNRQTDIMYLRSGWEKDFDEYHHCDTSERVKVVHRNGCGPTPAFCGNTVDGGNRTLLYDVNLDVEAFWREISGLADKKAYSSLEKISLLLQRSMYINCVYTATEYCMRFGRGEVTIEL